MKVMGREVYTHDQVVIAMQALEELYNSYAGIMANPEVKFDHFRDIAETIFGKDLVLAFIHEKSLTPATQFPTRLRFTGKEKIA